MGTNSTIICSPNSTTRNYLFTKLGLPILNRINSIYDIFFKLLDIKPLSLAFNESLSKLCNTKEKFPTRMKAFEDFLNERYLKLLFNPWRKEYP